MQIIVKRVGLDATVCGVRFDLRTMNPLNRREHWTARSKRVKAERKVTALALRNMAIPTLPAVVTLTREAVRAMDTDGLAASFKGVRDQIADWLQIDDANPLIEWRYAQRKAKGFHVLIEIQGKGNG